MFNNVAFMKEFINKPLISDLESRNLIKEYREGNEEALETLIQSLSRMIIGFIPIFIRNTEYGADMYQNGVLGCINAAKLFDLDSDVKFSTYAYVAIRNQIRNSKIKLLSIPSSLWQIISQYIEFAAGKKSVSEADACAALEITHDKYVKLMTYVDSSDVSSLDESAFRKSLYEDISTSIIRKIDYEQLRQTVSELKNQRQKEFILLHLGFDHDPLTFQEIGDLYGVSRQYVQKVYKQGIQKLHGNEAIVALAEEYL